MAITIHLKNAFTVDFRKTETTLISEMSREIDVDDMGPRDCVMLVSRTGKLMSLVFPHFKNKVITSPAGQHLKEPPRILPMHRYRIEGGGTFTPWLVQEYAEEMGFRIEDMRTFKQYFEADQQRRREEALIRKRDQEKEEALNHGQTATRTRVRQPGVPAPRRRRRPPDGNPV